MKDTTSFVLEILSVVLWGFYLASITLEYIINVS